MKFVIGAAVVAITAIGASAIAGADDPPGVNSPVDVASAQAERAFPQAADPRSLYGVLRTQAGQDDALPHAPAGAVSRAVDASGKGQPTFLSMKGDELCIVKVRSGDEPGGTACDIATNAGGRPPVLVLSYGPADGEQVHSVYGAAPDGAVSVRIVDGTGSIQEARVVDNAYAANLPAQRGSSKLLRDVQFVWKDHSVSTLINDGQPR